MISIRLKKPRRNKIKLPIKVISNQKPPCLNGNKQNYIAFRHERTSKGKSNAQSRWLTMSFSCKILMRGRWDRALSFQG